MRKIALILLLAVGIKQIKDLRQVVSQESIQ